MQPEAFAAGRKGQSPRTGQGIVALGLAVGTRRLGPEVDGRRQGGPRGFQGLLQGIALSEGQNVQIKGVGVGQIQGRGAAFLAAGMDYAGLMFPPAALRLTVAAFNRRAISVYQKLSFEISSTLTHRISQEPFYLMHRISSAAATVPTSLQYTGA